MAKRKRPKHGSWQLAASTLCFSDGPWVTFTFTRVGYIRDKCAVYYSMANPSATHIGMDVRRKGDPRLIEVAEAALAFFRLTGDTAGFWVAEL